MPLAPSRRNGEPASCLSDRFRPGEPLRLGDSTSVCAVDRRRRQTTPFAAASHRASKRRSWRPSRCATWLSAPWLRLPTDQSEPKCRCYDSCTFPLRVLDECSRSKVYPLGRRHLFLCVLPDVVNRVPLLANK